ncbi:MAG: right-handed parallel beta-helix repeat-containing protein, partial [Bacteroidota bacterium]
QQLWQDCLVPGDSYHLAPSSPAIAVGLDSLVGASLDLEGNVRPTVGTRPDAGAYELGVASLLVTNAQASGSGSLNQILSQLQRADGNYTIQFDPSLKGQNIPFEESWELGLGSYTLNGDVEGDQVADITLQGYATPGSFSFTAAGTTLNLKYLNFDSIGTTNQSTPPVISSSTSGKIFIEGCSFSNIATGIMSVSPTTDTLSIVVSNSRFQNNQNEFAGIIFANRAAAQVQFSNCIIQNNVLLEYANALFYMLSGRLTFENCLISDNVGDWIIYNTGNTVFEPGTLVVRHTTITNNTVEHNAIGLGDGGLELYNSLVVGNYSDTVALNVEPTGTFLANGSLFQGSAEGIFTDLLGGNYTLSDSSRAIDIGDPNEVGTLTTDLAGNPRPNGLPDAGAYESSVILHPVVTEVNLLVTNANPSGPGSFADAIASVNGQSDNFIISFDPSLAGQTIPYHTDTVMLAGSLTINGDVDGNNTSDIILDGVACQGVIFSVDNDITLRLRHLKFQDFEGLCGVAMFWIRNQGSIITESCEFVNLQRPVFKIENWTDNFPTHLTITDSRFTNLFGGGVFQSSSTEESTVTLRNCIIEKAFSPRGYLLWWSREQVTMENCLIVDNQVENLVYATGRSSSLVMRHCTIANNLVDPSFFDPGAIYAYIGTLSFYNTLLVGNTNSDDGTEETYSTRGSQTVLSTGGSILSGGSAGYFIDASQNDFTLAVNSPAIDAGDLALVGTLTTDLAGTPRPVSLPDVGAYEVTGTPAAPVVDSALVVSLSLDTCGGTIVTDAITSETVGALVGGTTRTAGYQGQGLRFDGVDDQVVLFDSTYDLTIGDGLSYSVWVYPTRNSERRETLIERVAAPVSSVLSLEFGEPIFYLGGLNNAYW